MKLVIQLLTLAVCTSLLLLSCHREEVLLEEPNLRVSSENDLSNDFGDQIILGEQEPIAFSLENVETAYQELYPNARKKKLKPTHLYVRFLPKNNEEAEY